MVGCAPPQVHGAPFVASRAQVPRALVSTGRRIANAIQKPPQSMPPGAYLEVSRACEVPRQHTLIHASNVAMLPHDASL